MDAWEQVYDITRANTRRWEVRPDIEVTALGVDRSVQLRLGTDSGKLNASGVAKDPIKVTKRNVGTMRELAAVLLAACDFVDFANPQWASHEHPPLKTPDELLKED